MTTTKNNEHKKLNFSSEREQSQACLNSAEHEKNQGRKVLNVPNLRFKEFQGEWEKKSLGEIGESFIGLTYKPTDVVSEGGLIVFRSSNIQNGCMDYKDIVRVNKNVKEKLITKKDDLLVCARNGSARLIGKNAILHEIDANQTFGAFMMVFRSDINHFVHQLLNTRLYSSQVSENLGARINQITSSDLSSFEFFFPKENSEMNKIAALLDLLDERIATQNKIIDKLQSLIKGIADKLFQTARTTKPLLEFAPNITSGTDKSGSGTIPLYGSTGIIGTVKNASQKGNIVLVARVGTIGTVQYVNEPCGVSDNALIVEAGEMTKYIYHFLKTYNFTRITSGTTQPLITASSLKKAAIPTYDIESQTRIVLCLNGLEKKLDMAKQYLSDIAVMKRYLLSQMFI